MWLTCGLTIVAITGATALAQSVGLIELPARLAFVAEHQLPWIFPVHMAAGGLSLILTPLAIVLSRKPARHRPVAIAAAAAVVVAAISAIPVSLASLATGAARAGFLVQALVWISLLAAGVRAILRGDRRRHRDTMILTAAVTSGAIVLRLMLLATAWLIPYGDFDAAYSIIVWASWLTPLAAAAIFIRQTRLNDETS